MQQRIDLWRNDKRGVTDREELVVYCMIKKVTNLRRSLIPAVTAGIVERPAEIYYSSTQLVTPKSISIVFIQHSTCSISETVHPLVQMQDQFDQALHQ